MLNNKKLCLYSFNSGKIAKYFFFTDFLEIYRDIKETLVFILHFLYYPNTVYFVLYDITN